MYRGLTVGAPVLAYQAERRIFRVYLRRFRLRKCVFEGVWRGTVAAPGGRG